MTEPHERLKASREKKYRSAMQAAKALRVPYGTYSAHENGSRGFNSSAKKYARHFLVNWIWLLTGEGTPDGSDQPYVQQVYDAIDPARQPDAIEYLEFLRDRSS